MPLEKTKIVESSARLPGSSAIRTAGVLTSAFGSLLMAYAQGGPISTVNAQEKGPGGRQVSALEVDPKDAARLVEINDGIQKKGWVPEYTETILKREGDGKMFRGKNMLPPASLETDVMSMEVDIDGNEGTMYIYFPCVQPIGNCTPLMSKTVELSLNGKQLEPGRGYTEQRVTAKESLIGTQFRYFTVTLPQGGGTVRVRVDTVYQHFGKRNPGDIKTFETLMGQKAFWTRPDMPSPFHYWTKEPSPALRKAVEEARGKHTENSDIFNSMSKFANKRFISSDSMGQQQLDPEEIVKTGTGGCSHYTAFLVYANPDLYPAQGMSLEGGPHSWAFHRNGEQIMDGPTPSWENPLFVPTDIGKTLVGFPGEPQGVNSTSGARVAGGTPKSLVIPSSARHDRGPRAAELKAILQNLDEARGIGDFVKQRRMAVHKGNGKI